MRALMSRPAAVVQLAANLLQHVTYTHKTLPVQGLSMLKMQDCVLGEAYYLGEFPVSCTWLEIQFPDGRKVDGAALVMSDSAELGLALALCDGILAHAGPGCTDVALLVEDGLRICERERSIRDAMLAKTQVNFSTVSVEEGVE